MESLNGPIQTQTPMPAMTWDFNEKYTKLILLKNISDKQVQYIDEKLSMTDVWKSLVLLY